MLKIDLKEPCYTCMFSNFQFDDFSGVAVLYCDRMPVCCIVDAYEHVTDTEKMTRNQNNDIFKMGVRHDGY